MRTCSPGYTARRDKGLWFRARLVRRMRLTARRVWQGIEQGADMTILKKLRLHEGSGCMSHPNMPRVYLAAPQTAQSILVRFQVRHLLIILLGACAAVATLSSTASEDPSVFLEQVRCVGGPYGLRLPKSLPQVLALGQIQREEVRGVERWKAYTATRKYVFYAGLTLGLVAFSNEPERYLVSFAEVSSPKWNRVSPFGIGESVASVQAKLGTAAAKDSALKSSYASESDSVRFQASVGKVVKVAYECYTG